MTEPYYQHKGITIYNGDCLEILPELTDNSIDMLLTDPPYGYSFMGKDWDKAVSGVEIWKECLRVLKPGAFCFVMSAPRQDVLSRIIVNLGDAGFRTDFTSIYWAYASGFPKAMSISKAVDKRGGKYLGWFIDYILEIAKQKGISRKELTNLFLSKNGKPTGWLWNKQYTQAITVEQYNKIKNYLDLPFENIEEAEREIIGRKQTGDPVNWFANQDTKPRDGLVDITASATPQAKALDGSYAGFQPKPAVEVIIVCIKPLSEKTYVDQALKNRKGITWLDDCIIPYESKVDKETARPGGKITTAMGSFVSRSGGKIVERENRTYQPKGRFPANLLVSDDVLNDGTNHISGKMDCVAKNDFDKSICYGKYNPHPAVTQKSEGSFSRFFDLDAWDKRERDNFPFIIVPKASKSEKNRGLIGEVNPIPYSEYRENFDTTKSYVSEYPDGKPRPMNKSINNHPTCKPIKLMRYLITLASRKGDLILDPFMGSGTTGIACKSTNRKFIGIEIENSEENKYCEMAKLRIIAMQSLSQEELFKIKRSIL